ncbi:MAG: glutamate-5-semialdehyde dehydrogenase [Selenomonadaceae bacterium]|nr:glutamate-5-semialdehyde dehydrogenase [Selenomonadaceae bacterium]
MLFMKEHVTKQARRAKEASRKVALLSGEERDAALLAMANALEERQPEILEVNAKEVASARESQKVRPNMIDRMILTPQRISAMAEGIRQVVKLPDPLEKVDFEITRPNGLKIRRMRVPFGVVGIVYESRPNVTADAIALCLKSGNACLLRGGSEVVRTNKTIVEIMRDAAVAQGVPEKFVEFISIHDRDAVVVMCRLRKLVDVIIPRGGAGLIARVVEHSTVPVIETGTGICHTFVDASADLDMALKVCMNAKTQRPSVCNAMETLLIHRDIAEEFLPKVARAMIDAKVELRGDEACRKIFPEMNAATDEDWATEYNDLILSVKIVDDVDAAIEHINTYGTQHSESIITRDENSAAKFKALVDAATVYVNASTRFTDGFEFGFGAEIGISTQKLHARGPMGLEALTTMKYFVDGDGQVRG